MSQLGSDREEYEESLGGFWGDGIKGEMARKMAKKYGDAALAEADREFERLVEWMVTQHGYDEDNVRQFASGGDFK